MAPVFDEKRGATVATLLLSACGPLENTPITLTMASGQELTDRLRNVNGTELVRVYGTAGRLASTSTLLSLLQRKDFTLTASKLI